MTIEDLATIINRLRVQYPTLFVEDNGISVQLNQEQYDARILEMAVAERAQQIADDADNTKRTLRQQVKAALSTLDANHTALSGTGNLTTAQLRAMLDDVTRVCAGVIRVLVD